MAEATYGNTRLLGCSLLSVAISHFLAFSAAAATLQGLGAPTVADISSDGSVVVGFLIDAGFAQEAYRWTSGGGVMPLGFLPGGNKSQAEAVSANGSVIVGAADGQAFRWTSGGGMVGLGDLPGGAFDGFARAVTLDGTGIVGHGTSSVGLEAFRWTSTTGMVGLGDLPGGTVKSEASASTRTAPLLWRRCFRLGSRGVPMDCGRWTGGSGCQFEWLGPGRATGHLRRRPDHSRQRHESVRLH